jgi:hypothetical protein
MKKYHPPSSHSPKFLYLSTNVGSEAIELVTNDVSNEFRE